jgi:L-ascorbate metabolism protein UlaG (beta-lactamase superfamily)
LKKVKPRLTIPCHCNTFSSLEVNPKEFKQKVGSASQVEILDIGVERTYKY